MEDVRLIDANALKTALHNFFDGKVIDEPTYILRDVFSYIDNAPTVQPHGNWVPVSERLPIRNGVYTVTRIIEETAIIDACYFDGQNTWHSDNRVNHGRPYLTDVIAWQPRPEAYKEGGAI